MSRSIDTVEKARQAGATEADIQLCWLWLAYVSGPGASPRPQSPPLVRRRPHHRLAEPEQRGIWPDAGRRSPAAGAAAGYRAGPGGLPQASGPVLQAGDRHFALRQPRLPPLPFWTCPTRRWCSTASGTRPGSTPAAWWGWWAGRHPDEYGLWAASELGRQAGPAGRGHRQRPGRRPGRRLPSGGGGPRRPPTIGVQGVPIDKPYPKSTIELRRAAIEHGCVVGEYAPGEDGVGKNGFLLRNRLIAGLSPGAGGGAGRGKRAAPCPRWNTPSGTAGRSTPCPPGWTGRSPRGSNLLIAQGRAELVMDGAGILRRMNGGEACAPGPEARARPAQSRPEGGCRRDAGAGRAGPPGARSGQRGGAFRLLPGRYG